VQRDTIVAHLALIEPAGPTRGSWLVAKTAGLTREGAGWSLNRPVPREGAGNRLVPQERELADCLTE